MLPVLRPLRFLPRLLPPLIALLAGACDADPPGDLVAFRLSWQPGGVRRYEWSMQVEVTTSGAFEMTMGQDLDMVLREEVRAVDPDGTATLSITYESVRAEVRLPGGVERDFDSTEPETEEAAQEALTERFSRMVGKSILLRMTPAGRVLDVTGIEELMQGVLGEDNAFSSLFRDDTFRKLVESAYMLPAESVAFGDTWDGTLHQQIPFLGHLALSYDCRLDGFEQRGGRRCARVIFRVAGEIEPEEPPEESGEESPAGDATWLTAVDVELDSTAGEGSFLFDVERGVQLVSVIHLDMRIRLPEQDVALAISTRTSQGLVE